MTHKLLSTICLHVHIYKTKNEKEILYGITESAYYETIYKVPAA